MVKVTIYFLREQLLNMADKNKDEIVAIRQANIRLTMDNTYPSDNKDNVESLKKISEIPVTIFIKKTD